MTVFDLVPTERIAREAAEIRPGRVLLTIFAALFFAAGWVTARLFGAVWLMVAWSAAAVKVGWQEGRKQSIPPRT